MRKPRGSAIAFVCFCVVLMSAFLGVVVSATFYQSRMALSIEARNHARDLAEAAIQMALARVAAAENFGQNQIDEILVPADGYPPGSSGHLTFSPQRAGELRMLYSSNNLGNEVSSPGDECSVPGQCLHLIGLGVCGDSRAQVEAMIRRPPFPLGVASAAPVRLEGVTVWGQTGPLPDPDLDPEQRLPAHVFSNSVRGDALSIDGSCVISGNAGAAGGVVVEPGAVVRGEVTPQRPPQSIPAIPVRDLVTRVKASGGLVPYASGRPVETYSFVAGGLNEGGDIHLDGGVLAVEGPLRVTGKIYGRGAVLVDGEVSIGQGSSLSTTQQLALAATGKVSLQGSGEDYYLQGLVYSDRGLQATRLTVIGALLSNSTTPGDEMRLENMQMIQAPVAVQVAHGLPTTFEVSSSGDEDSAAISIHAEPDPDRPGQFRFWGEAWYSEDPLCGTPLWPQSNGDEIYHIVMKLPDETNPQGRAVYREGRIQGNVPVWFSTQTLTFNGTRADTMAKLQFLWASNADRDYFPQVRARIDAYLNALEGRGSGPVINLHANNLRSPIERTKVLLWREIEAIR